METPTVVISMKDLPVEDDDAREQAERARDHVEKRCRALSEEFPETTRFEVTMGSDGVDYTAHAHVTGKNTDVATHASAGALRPTTDRLLDRVERQLRRVHDKRIFVQRREAMQANSRR